MAIIVTGASGHFGRAAAERILERVSASEVILTTRNPQSLADFSARGVSVRFADFDQPETLKEAFKGGERMLLISTARVGTRVGQHRNAIEAAAAEGVRQIAYTSILGAATPGHPAIVTRDHRATELILEASGVQWTFLRDSQYAEAVADVIAPVAIMRGSLPGSACDGRIAFVSRRDCVACAAAVLTTPGHGNRAYNLTGPELFTFPQAMALVSKIAGRQIDYIRVTDDDMFAYFDEMGAPRHASDIPHDSPIPWSSDDMVTFEQAIREGFFDVLSNDVETLTGEKPMSLEAVLRLSASAWPKA